VTSYRPDAHHAADHEIRLQRRARVEHEVDIGDPRDHGGHDHADHVTDHDHIDQHPCGDGEWHHASGGRGQILDRNTLGCDFILRHP
jgi:hypothetical protein